MSRLQRAKAKRAAMAEKARAWKTGGPAIMADLQLVDLQAAAASKPRWMTDPAHDAELNRIAFEEADAWARSVDGTPYGRRGL